MTPAAEQPSSFFGLAMPLLEQGYAPLPVRDKQPVVRGWQHYCTQPPDEQKVERWRAQFPLYSVGAACGCLVALDIDDETEDGAEALQARAFKALGETPLIRIGRAPRRVLLYQAPEPFRSMSTVQAQVLALGKQVVLFGMHPMTHRPYAWPGPTPLDTPLKDLPPISEDGARQWLGQQPPQVHPRKRHLVDRNAATAVGATPDGQDGAHEGTRNAFIFDQALQLAVSAVSFDDLLTRLDGLNKLCCRPPLSANEIGGTARSVWGYRQSGCLFQKGGPAKTFIDAAEFERLADEPGAIVLLLLFRLSHSARQEPFRIVKEAMSRKKLIANWSPKMYDQGRDVLLDRGFIDRVYEGGGRGNPHLYVLCKPSRIGTQYKGTLFSSSSLCEIQKSSGPALNQSDVAGASSVTTMRPEPTLFDLDALPQRLTPDW